ncbi:hypothetical protein P170DRAFT_494360 [Aspergillus steynii IBT 23096]|uniref:F-box domain-containing protein n=1 Tax=Aspergillus steynii IBT 23096 TaxID=1392250 RepID=A0A2I2G7G6_9EURO|nr:uncharacterized protein P170DRAFT_494360 [Aspergillus steynii IBT 23096]PLB48826.1 hypothetical protein P170DRAFT_494360 [Aspergillus steynii IBT 23096]
MSSLDIFPPELLECIISHLPSPDLKSLRLTCHAVNDLATRWVFRRVYICIDSVRNNTIHHEREGFKELVDKYAPFIRDLEVDGGDGNRIESMCPFEVAPFLQPMLFLETLSMTGPTGYWFQAHGGYLMGPFETLMLRASLLTPSAERIFPRLRSLNLCIWEGGDEDWFLDNLGVLFIIPSLENLQLETLVLSHHDPKLPAAFDLDRQRTNLKSLTITNSYINITALEKILSMPRSLTCLQLHHRDSRDYYRPEDWREFSRPPQDLYRAISQQRASLETLAVDWDLESVRGYGLDLSVERFPQLRSYDGTYPDSSRRF